MLTKKLRGLLRIRTNIKVEVLDLRGKLTDLKRMPNLYTTIGLNLLRGALGGDYTAINDGTIRYVAIGDNNTAPALGNTTLVNEVFRKPVTSIDIATDAVCESILYIAASEAVGAIEEIGWFCGPSATATADTGSLLARVLYSRVKTNLEAIRITRTDTLEEAP